MFNLVRTSPRTEAGDSVHTCIGLPLQIAVVYTLLFVAGFWFYSLLWSKDVPLATRDTASYLSAAQEFFGFSYGSLTRASTGLSSSYFAYRLQSIT